MELILENWNKYLRENSVVALSEEEQEEEQKEQVLQAAEKIEDSERGDQMLQQALKDPKVVKKLEKIASKLSPELTEGSGEAKVDHSRLYDDIKDAGLGAFLGATVLPFATNAAVLTLAPVAGLAAAGAGVVLLAKYIERRLSAKAAGDLRRFAPPAQPAQARTPHSQKYPERAKEIQKRLRDKEMARALSEQDIERVKLQQKGITKGTQAQQLRQTAKGVQSGAVGGEFTNIERSLVQQISDVITQIASAPDVDLGDHRAQVNTILNRIKNLTGAEFAGEETASEEA